MKTLTPKTRDALLAVAAWQIGVLESPAGSNRVKYNTDFYGREVSGAAWPWCMAFVWWVFHEAGFNLFKTPSCTELANRYRASGQWVSEGFKPGDIVMFDFSGRKSKTEHCGIVESVSRNGKTVTTIEGNTGSGNDANGGAVQRRVRDVKFITGACRPGFNM